LLIILEVDLVVKEMFMKIVPCTEKQLRVLKYIHPEKRVSPYLALVPASEYFFWSRRFTHLLDGIAAHIYPIKIKDAIKLPVIQCVAKLIGINQDGFLIPKVFKFGSLPEGTFKDFGLSTQVVPLLDTLAETLPYPIRPFPHREHKVDCLGFLAWDDFCPAINQGDKYLQQFMPCTNANRLKNIKIQNKICYENREYSYLLPTNNYYENDNYQRVIQELNDLKMLLLPLNFPLDNLQTLIGFTDPSWAEVKPLEFFLDENPENLARYVLLRTDDGKIITWNDVVQTPKLRLEIEMSDYWLWQEACRTEEALDSLNLYWEFGQEYPWLIDKRDNTFVPVFIVED
jgi:hypothetical protein